MSEAQGPDISRLLKVGDHTYGAENIVIASWSHLGIEEGGASVIVGKYCSVADNILVFLGGNHRVDWVSTHPFPAKGFPGVQHLLACRARTKGPVVIGNDAWIGHGVTILSGVTIGNGCCIGAKSVVTQNMPDYWVCAGNPCRPKRPRADSVTINALLAVAWWDWPDDWVREAAPLLCTKLDWDAVEAMAAFKRRKHDAQA